jgi:DNA modification methylase
LKDFTRPIPQYLLDIEEKNRSNLFTWRGQFSPQLIEYILEAYCPDDAVLLDPFVGSGTVLFEAANMGLSAFGFEINPSAWSFSKLSEFSNLSFGDREQIIAELRSKLETEFPIILFSDQYLLPDKIEERIVRISASISDKAKILCNALVVLLDIFNNRISSEFVQNKFMALAKLVRSLPYSAETIKADLHDARCLPLEDQSIDFVITSPPYINVFNYHQNYRRSVEILGWDVLRVARSEIGSNRANRSNRFYTVVQYCIDIAHTLQEMARIMKIGGRAVLIMGYESKVLGVSFYNANLIENIANDLNMFDIVSRQQRVFKNRFGQPIREDIFNLTKRSYSNGFELAQIVGRKIAHSALQSAKKHVPIKNHTLLNEAILRTQQIKATPLFNSASYADYQTRDYIMMVTEH